MPDVKVIPTEQFGHGFIPAEHLPRGRDEHYLRNKQAKRPDGHWRNLRADEIETLVKNGNSCDDWDLLLARDPFDPRQIRNCDFHGLVRLGSVRAAALEHHELQMPVGITNSRIISCDIGDDCAIHDVRYLAHYILGDSVMLLNVDEMHTTNHAKFGNGIVKEGEEEDVRVWLDVINETSGRAILPFDGMMTADAYIWARYREDRKLQKMLIEMVQRRFDSRRGFYGMVGDRCVIKNTRIIKDVRVGQCCYIKGANKLKNLTINSSAAESTQIGEGVELVNGIIGLGCHVFYGCKAVRFVLCDNSHLKYGARLIHSVLGSNSTVSCCEILHNLVFPAHEQHHNNSFLTAALVKGQSNIAAGATVGSNHNSRANDGEIEAGRGFWPGLCVSLKHSSKFASFSLVAKGAYPAELNVPLPFSLVSNNETAGRLEIMPAYWWLYNMYALARNTWKFLTRDKRKTKAQNIEFDSLAPDTAEEIFAARRLLEVWTAKAHLRAAGRQKRLSESKLAAMGRELLAGDPAEVRKLEVLGEGVEKSRRDVRIGKVAESYRAYGEMLHYYAVKNLLDYLNETPKATLASMRRKLAGQRETRWENLGGQLAPAGQVAELLSAIKSGKLADWGQIHEQYNRMWGEYPLLKRKHAMATLLELLGEERLTAKVWAAALDEAVRIQKYICRQVRSTRAKDYDNPFRRATFASEAEMLAVVGSVDDNSFVQQTEADTKAFLARVRKAKRLK